MDDLLKQIGLENELLSQGLTFLFGAGMMVLVLSFRGVVSNGLVKGIFLFLAIVLGTFLLIKGIRFVIGFVRGDTAGEAA